MTSKPFEEAVDRVERALLRIERAVERGAMNHDNILDKPGRDEELRTRVANALGELDQIIREAERG
jgi:hypothetical protein